MPARQKSTTAIFNPPEKLCLLTFCRLLPKTFQEMYGRIHAFDDSHKCIVTEECIWYNGGIHPEAFGQELKRQVIPASAQNVRG